MAELQLFLIYNVGHHLAEAKVEHTIEISKPKWKISNLQSELVETRKSLNFAHKKILYIKKSTTDSLAEG